MALTSRQKEERAEARKARSLYDVQIDNAVDLLVALHIEGFRALFLESMLMDVAPFEAFICVWLDDTEIGPERMTNLQDVAAEMGASISLAQPLGPSSPSRIRLWPSRER